MVIGSPNWAHKESVNEILKLTVSKLILVSY